MIEKVIFLMVSVAFIMPVIWNNNNELISGCTNWKAKICCWFLPRKNTIISCILGGMGGTILAWTSFYCHGNTVLYTIKLLFMYCWLISAAYIDGKTQRIPNRWILYGLSAGAVFYLVEGVLSSGWFVLLGQGLLGAMIGGGVLLISTLLSKGGIGMGDVKLYMVLGILVGWQMVLRLLVLTLVGALIYGFIMMISKKMSQKSKIPLGPFAFLASAIGILLGI